MLQGKEAYRMSYFGQGLKTKKLNDVVKELAENPEGMSVLTYDEAKALADRMRSASNKRLKRLREQGAMGKASPALKAAEEALGKKGAKFSTRGKNRNQLLSEISKMRNFMMGKTSTLSGWKKVRDSENKRIGFPKRFSERKRKAYWRLVNKVYEANFSKIKALEEVAPSDVIQRFVREQMDIGADEDAILDRAERGLDELYKQIQNNEEIDEDALQDSLDIDYSDSDW